MSKLYAIFDVDAIARVAGEVTPALLGDVTAAAIEAGVRTVQLRAKSSSPQAILKLAAAMRTAVEVAAASNKSEQQVPPLPLRVPQGPVGMTALGAKAEDLTPSANPAERCHSERSEEPALFSSATRTTLILNDRPDLALLAGFDGCHLGQEDLSIAGARRILSSPKLLGLSTHAAEQVRKGDATDVDYLAIGPIFATVSKQNAAAVVGLEQLAQWRALTQKPLVAIGGITRGNARSVLAAGADSVAIIGDLLRDASGAATLPALVARNCTDILTEIL